MGRLSAFAPSSDSNVMKRRCPRFTMCANCRNLAWALGPLLAGLLIAASTASADTAVVGLSPKVARPGERVDLRVVCGACRRADTSFPISLVPVAKAPPPHPCRVKLKGHMETGLCSPTAARPPSERPFVLLGSTSRGRRALPAGSWPPGSDSDLRFAVPEIEPGRYAFVIFCAECGRALAREPDSRHEPSWQASSDPAERGFGAHRRGRCGSDLVDRRRYRDRRAGARGRPAAPSAASSMSTEPHGSRGRLDVRTAQLPAPKFRFRVPGALPRTQPGCSVAPPSDETQHWGREGLPAIGPDRQM